MKFGIGRGFARTLLALAAPALLVACGSSSQPAGGGAAPASQTAVLPDGLALMPGAKVTSTEVPGGGQADAPTSMVRFEVAAKADEVAKFYKAEFARVGLKVENDIGSGGNIVVTGKAHDGEDLVVNAEDGAGGGATQVTISTAASRL
jgi:hypothetical protein